MSVATKPPVKPRRTISIVVLTILAAVAGIVAVLDVLRFLGLAPWYNLGALGFYSQSWLGALLSGIVAAIWFGVAADLWALDQRGWLFMAVIATINLVFLVLALFGQSTWQAISVSFVVNLVALVLAMLPSTKAAFGVPQQAPRR